MNVWSSTGETIPETLGSGLERGIRPQEIYIFQGSILALNNSLPTSLFLPTERGQSSPAIFCRPPIPYLIMAQNRLIRVLGEEIPGTMRQAFLPLMDSLSAVVTGMRKLTQLCNVHPYRKPETVWSAQKAPCVPSCNRASSLAY